MSDARKKYSYDTKIEERKITSWKVATGKNQTGFDINPCGVKIPEEYTFDQYISELKKYDLNPQAIISVINAIEAAIATGNENELKLIFENLSDRQKEGVLNKISINCFKASYIQFNTSPYIIIPRFFDSGSIIDFASQLNLPKAVDRVVKYLTTQKEILEESKKAFTRGAAKGVTGEFWDLPKELNVHISSFLNPQDGRKLAGASKSTDREAKSEEAKEKQKPTKK